VGSPSDGRSHARRDQLHAGRDVQSDRRRKTGGLNETASTTLMHDVLVFFIGYLFGASSMVAIVLRGAAAGGRRR